jgi:GH43 family beta-xylosidase
MKQHVLRWLMLPLLALGLSLGQNQATFTNPILTSGPDPHLTFFQGQYYLTTTSGRDIRLRQAKSLATLGQAETTVVYTETEPERCCHLWAPEFHRLQNPQQEWRWYVYYTAGPADCCASQRMHVLESASDDPLGPYTYKGRLFDTNHDYWAIDPTVFENKGQLYTVYSGTPKDKLPYEKPQHLYIAALENPWTIRGERVQISAAESPWEYGGAPVNEGPALVKRASKLYLSFSGSGCWTDDYAAGVLVASENADLLNAKSWQKMPKPFLKRNDKAGAYGPGHNSFFKSPDGKEDWIIYHANPDFGLECKDQRSPRAQKVIWGPDGLPQVNPVPIGAPVALPSGDPGPDR